MGNYRLRVSTDVEDLAENNLQRLFDTPVDLAAGERPVFPFVDIPFEIR